MLTQSKAEENSAPRLTPAIKPCMPWRVAAVEPLPEFKLHVRFNDGLEGIVHMASFVLSREAGVFAVLADPLIFKQVCIEYGAVTWPGELDLAPDAMYREIQATGKWVL